MKLFVTLLSLVVVLPALAACVSSAVYTSRVEKRFPPIGQIVDNNGKGVHVIEQGITTGPVVLMIHGASANAREFTGTLAPQLKDTHRILMADRPGHGYSGRPADARTLGVQAAQMAFALEALAPGEKATIVGHSFGGAVALRLALDRPDLGKLGIPKSLRALYSAQSLHSLCQSLAQASLKKALLAFSTQSRPRKTM